MDAWQAPLCAGLKPGQQRLIGRAGEGQGVVVAEAVAVGPDHPGHPLAGRVASRGAAVGGREVLGVRAISSSVR